MRYVLAALAAYVLVLAYSVFFASTLWSWIPLVLCGITIVATIAEHRVAWFFACIAGILLDSHFQYLGPYVVLFIGTLSIVHWLQGVIAERHYILSVITFSSVVSIWYTVGLYLMSGLLIGFHRYPLNSHWLILTCLRMLCIIVLLSSGLLLSYGLRTVTSYARR